MKTYIITLMLLSLASLSRADYYLDTCWLQKDSSEILYYVDLTTIPPYDTCVTSNTRGIWEVITAVGIPTEILPNYKYHRIVLKATDTGFRLSYDGDSVTIKDVCAFGYPPLGTPITYKNAIKIGESIRHSSTLYDTRGRLVRSNGHNIYYNTHTSQNGIGAGR